MRATSPKPRGEDVKPTSPGRHQYHCGVCSHHLIKLASASVVAAEARSDGSGRGKSSAADAAASALTFRGGPSEQNSITERDLKRRHSSGVYGYHPAQSQGHIKAATMARAVQKATHKQRFCLGVITPTVCLQQRLAQSIPPVCTSRIASAVSSL